MRFNVSDVLLGLVALSSLPASSGRAIPNSSPGAVELYNYDSNYYVPRAIVRVGGGGKSGGGKSETTTTGGSGDKTTTGGDRSSDGQTTRIGAGDSGDSSSGSNSNVHIGDPDIYCRGTGCGSSGDTSSTSTLTSAEKKVLSDRGTKGISLVANPSKGSVDYSQRMGNYKFKEEEFQESIDETIPAMGLDKSYGFSTTEDGWKTWEVKSTNNNLEPIVEMSFGRSKAADGKDYLAFVAHQRYAERDGNRFKLTKTGDNVKDGDKNVEQPDKDTKAIPVAQLTYEAAAKSGQLTPAEKVFLISENVANPEAKKAIVDAHTALGVKDGESHVWKMDATGVEGDHAKILAGTDNNYSYENMAGRNPDFFSKYTLVSIETYNNPPMMKMELDLKK
ncbi:hypothetical protein SLS56_006788 [Neofusicoccum ribis]|uniref:Uncharacterized protein n=1 Tax=Neofusicoccum ribis TaxID=45134 RepID=A0ABR3SPT5_9PEZI